MDADSHKIYAMVAANLSMTPIQSLAAKLEPVLAMMLVIAQIGVAIATITYTVRKMRDKKKDKE